VGVVAAGEPKPRGSRTDKLVACSQRATGCLFHRSVPSGWGRRWLEAPGERVGRARGFRHLGVVYMWRGVDDDDESSSSLPRLLVLHGLGGDVGPARRGYS
jgi:hypothetical protein